MGHWIFTEEHELFRKTVRKFIANEVTPNIEQWEEDGEIPRHLFLRFAELGYLGIHFPEEYGGSDLDLVTASILTEEMARAGAGGVGASIGSHTNIALPVIANFGSHAQKEKYLTPGIKGEKVAALGISEPEAGSDVASMKTTAKREGDHYVLNGSKTFITNGVNSDFVLVAAKTKEEPKHKNISFFIVEKEREGFTTGKKLKKLGWRSSDTGELFFDDVKVPAGNLIGEENKGFRYIMSNFQWERITMALGCIGLAETTLEASINYSKERKQFGRPLAKFQVLNHKMADMAVEIEKTKNLTYRALYLYENGEDALKETTMAKKYASEMINRVTDQAVQIHGGAGYMMEYPVQRYWRDGRIQSIGGGTTQVMNEILVKQLGIVSAE